FSRTLSKTTTVSYREYPRMVSSPMTVAGVTSQPTTEYTPTVTRRTWSSATRAEVAILQLRKYTDRTTVTRTMKTASPWRACRVMSCPQEGPMKVEVTSVSGTS